jgi:hypothetical protein
MLTWDEEIKPTSPLLNQRSTSDSCAAALPASSVQLQAVHVAPAALSGIDY